MGLHKIIGVVEADELHWMRLRGEDDIQLEIERHKALLSANKDALNWTDADWFHYVHAQPAEEKALPAGLFSANTLDKGHQGMRLADFTRHPNAVAAGLKRAHVLALRLYTSSVYRAVNKPLHDGCSLERPHPYPALVLHLTDACRRLSTAAAQNAAENAKPLIFWLGCNNMEESGASEFKQRGGAEVSLLSTSKLRPISEKHSVIHAKKPNPYAAKKAASPSKGGDDDKSNADQILLLRLRVEPQNACGADVSFLSVYPHECEYIFPPCTYLEPRGDNDEASRQASADGTACKVIDVVPHSFNK